MIFQNSYRFFCNNYLSSGKIIVYEEKLYWLVGRYLFFFSCAVQNPQKVYESSLKSISAENLKRDLYIIASDEMQEEILDLRDRRKPVNI